MLCAFRRFSPGAVSLRLASASPLGRRTTARQDETLPAADAGGRVAPSVPVSRVYGCGTIDYLLLCIWHIVKLIERDDKIAMFFDVKRGERFARERDRKRRERERRERERKGREETTAGGSNLRQTERRKEIEERRRERENRMHARREKESAVGSRESAAALSVMNPRDRCETTRTVRILSSPVPGRCMQKWLKAEEREVERSRQ